MSNAFFFFEKKKKKKKKKKSKKQKYGNYFKMSSPEMFNENAEGVNYLAIYNWFRNILFCEFIFGQ